MTVRIPARLSAPAPGWVTSADVIVVGSGIAGLTAALRLRQRVDRVLLVTKTVLPEGSTQWAQGGIAAALDPVALRSLDAVHLASAMSIGDDLDAMITYDVRLADAARAVGLIVVAPA